DAKAGTRFRPAPLRAGWGNGTAAKRPDPSGDLPAGRLELASGASSKKLRTNRRGVPGEMGWRRTPGATRFSERPWKGLPAAGVSIARCGRARIYGGVGLDLRGSGSERRSAGALVHLEDLPFSLPAVARSHC